MGQPFNFVSSNVVLNKPRIFAVIVAVVILHIGVLWAISLLPAAKLKTIQQKKPIQVTIISEPVKPVADTPVKKAQEKPTQQAKPKVQPQPTAKKQPKTTSKTNVLTTKKTTNTQDNKVQKSNTSKTDDTLQSKETTTTTTVTQRQNNTRQNDQKDNQEKTEEKKNTSEPKKVSLGEVSWKREPFISEKAILKYLKKEDGVVVIKVQISSDAMGNVTQVKVITSSSNKALDEYVVKQVKKAKFKPYVVNGVNVPFEAPPLEFKLNVN